MSRDPRFFRSQQGVARSGVRQKQSYRLIIAAGVFLLALALALTYVAYEFITSPAQFIVRNLIIEGTVFADSNDIRNEVIKITEGNMLMVDLREVCEAVEKVPWVREATARKILPDTLQLTVKERIPEAYALIGGEIFLTDDSGTLIDRLRSEHPFIGFPIIRGLDALPEEEVAVRIKTALDILKTVKSARPDWYERISEVDISDPFRLTLVLVDGLGPVIVGNQDVLNRLYKYFLIEASLHQRYDTVEYIDVRFERRLVAKAAGR